MNVALQTSPRLLKRLAKDTTGNTLMLVAAATIPLTAMIGAGVDISRSYLVKSRLQAACDAGALAARKFMTSTTLDSITISKSRAFFNNNFPDASFGSSDIAFTPTLGPENEVKGTAVAKLPMTVMTAFGNKFTDISVKCDAKLDIGNTDVALVLDVTGSMGQALGGSTRIAVLKEAVINFYTTLGPGNDSRGRIRYAVVPYSTNVNLTGTLPDEAVIGGTGSDTWIYQTRVANMNTPVYTGTPGTPTNLGYQIYGSSINASNCARYGRNQSFSGFAGGANPLVTGGPPPAETRSIQHSNNATTDVDWGWSGATDTSGSNRTCRRTRTETVTTYAVSGYSFTNWIYKRAAVDVGGYAAGDTVNIFTGSSSQIVEADAPGEYNLRQIANTAGFEVTGGVVPVRWTGCIEERDTINTITTATPVNTLPAGALDLDIDTLPTDDATRWRPIWTELLYSRATLAESTSGTKMAAYGCPANPARRLMQYSSIDSAPTGYSGLSSFRNFINNLVIGSGTMHDIGFIWGARIISGDGLFQADNPDIWAGQPVTRHIVFLTDGEMNAHHNQFVFHGINELDQRVAPRGTTKLQIDDIHNRRLRIACEQAKQRNMTVWIIAFADGQASDYPDLLACASTEDHFKFAANAVDLNNEFQRIASAIAQLRLTN